MGFESEKMMNRYSSFQEWLTDFQVYEANPNDETFLKALQKRTNGSSKELRAEIQMFLQNQNLDKNPFEVFGRVARELGPEYFIVVKSTNDPWFEV